MDSSLAAYLPQDRRAALTRGEELPERTYGAALFADISGFTPLTGRLERALGARRGVEALVQHINLIYEALIAEVERFGGSVIGFAGDSITCWFDDEKVKSTRQKAKADQPANDLFTFDLLPAAHRAAACALALQQAMQQFAAIALPDGTTTTLALKVAVTSGQARRFVVGDSAIQLLDTLAGATVRRMAAGEHLALAGEVLIDDATATALGDSISISEWRADTETGARFAVLHELKIENGELKNADAADEFSQFSIFHSQFLRPWLLPAVYERHLAGLGDFLTELRPVVALFLRFSGLDYDGDPDASSKLDTFIQRVQQILARYDGALLQLTIGDKGSYLYAAFGAPTAHEDDARRAAHAALACLELPDELRFVQPLQIGISCGVMRVGTCGSTTRHAYGAMGDEVNLAARLMGRAGPGEALISGRVQAALATEFALEPLEPIPLKGMPEPLPIFRLAGLQRREVRLSEPAYALPMVGRAAELALIGAKLDLALVGRGQLVGIVAEAGMGKSRLLAEAIRLARRKRLRGFGGGCQSYGTNTPYLVWESVWRAFFNLDPEMPARRQLRALESLIEDWVPERREALPLLGPLLGLNLPANDFTKNLEPQYRKSALEALLLDCLQAAAREAAEDGTGLLLVLEDLHWIDALSHDLLERVAQSIADLPVLIVLAYRPPELLRLQSPRIEALAHFTRIDLAPLADAEAAQAIRAKLAQLVPERKGAVTAALIERISAKAQGNPFYIEELLNYLRDRGVDPQDSAAIEQLDLPSSLHTLILSRIDQLSEHERAAIKVASVIGRLFRFAHLHGAYPVLGDAALLRANLDALAKLDLTPLDTPEPELAYLFKHIVTQEVAYESLTAQARASLHEHLAAFLERLAGDNAERFVDLLAYHYDRSDNLAKKRHYLKWAGEAAATRFANDAAVDYLTRALALAPKHAATTRYKLLLARERVYDLQGAREAQAYDVRALETLAEQLDDNRVRAEIAVRRSNYAERISDLSAAAAAAAQGVTWAEAAGDVGLMAEGEFCWAQALPGKGTGGGDHLVRALELARVGGRADLEPHILQRMGGGAYYSGDYATGQAHLVEALTCARAIGDRQSESWVLIGVGDLSKKAGLYRDAEAALTQSLALTRIIGDRRIETYALVNLASLAATEGAYERALDAATQGQALAQAIGDRFTQALAHMLGGHGLVGLGRLDAAAAAYQLSCDVFEAAGRFDAAVEPLAGLARLTLAQGDIVDALAHVEPILAQLVSGKAEPQEETLRVDLTCYQVLRAMNDPRGHAVLEAAYAKLQEQAAKITDEAMRRSFLENVPYHRDLAAAWAAAQS